MNLENLSGKHFLISIHYRYPKPSSSKKNEKYPSVWAWHEGTNTFIATLIAFAFTWPHSMLSRIDSIECGFNTRAFYEGKFRKLQNRKKHAVLGHFLSGNKRFAKKTIKNKHIKPNVNALFPHSWNSIYVSA